MPVTGGGVHPIAAEAGHSARPAPGGRRSVVHERPAQSATVRQRTGTFVSALGPTNSTSWVIVGKGIPVQYAQGGVIAARATSVTLNGQRL